MVALENIPHPNSSLMQTSNVENSSFPMQSTLDLAGALQRPTKQNWVLSTSI